MPDYEVTAIVSVEVKMFVNAESADAAKALISDRLAIDAILVDVPPERFTLITDSIDMIEGLSAEQVVMESADPESLIE